MLKSTIKIEKNAVPGTDVVKIAVCRLIDVCSQKVESPFSPLSEEGLKKRMGFHTIERLCWGGVVQATTVACT